MKYFYLIILVFCFSINAYSKPITITVLETVRVKNEKRAEALFYYENNWTSLREKALELGYIHSYELIETKADGKAPFDIVLITRYSDQAQFERSEQNFQRLIKARGKLRLLNDLKPNDFRANVFVTIGKSGLKTASATKD